METCQKCIKIYISLQHVYFFYCESLFAHIFRDLEPSKDPDEIFKAIREGKLSFLNLSTHSDSQPNCHNFCCDLLCHNLGDEVALSRLMVQLETLSRVDERGWIPLHEAAVKDNKSILEMVFSGGNALSV